MPAVLCPCCARALTVEELVALATRSWPVNRWFALACPDCGSVLHVEARDGGLVVGTLDGAPGPVFLPHEAVAVPGLTVQAHPHGVALAWPGGHRTIPYHARPRAAPVPGRRVSGRG